ncbi:phosphatase PAP2 family protein [Streptomyces sp. NPDC048506]|uniref:phosphatase PAP2 family protein n=1 Tax=Streptomyces sp. NPDC048506 TaxID=3155028 RepID=UPI0034405B66
MTALRRIKWQYALIAVVAAAAAAFGLLATPASPLAVSGKKSKPGATARIKASPPPQLFTDAQVAPLAKEVAAQQKTADALFAEWKKEHGATRDDSAFTAWAVAKVPAPPSAKDRTAELHQVQQLAKTRTTAGKKAATWLEIHGKKDIWKLYLHDQRELLPKTEGDADKAQLKAALKLAKALSEKLAARYHQSAPYVLDPSLRTDKHLTTGQKCPCSYPSHHGAASATAVTFLTALDPHRADEYRSMQSQVLYSRLYMAGHVTSDITAGALLGDLVGDYALLANGHTTSAAAK